MTTQNQTTFLYLYLRFISTIPLSDKYNVTDINVTRTSQIVAL